MVRERTAGAEEKEPALCVKKMVCGSADREAFERSSFLRWWFSRCGSGSRVLGKHETCDLYKFYYMVHQQFFMLFDSLLSEAA